jgi:hypothetical protein
MSGIDLGKIRSCDEDAGAENKWVASMCVRPRTEREE